MSFLGAQNSIALGVQGLIHIDTGVVGSADYLLAKSLRFRSSASAYLNRTPATAGNRTTWTWSGWVKRGTLSTGTIQRIFSVDSSPSGGPSGIWFNGTTDTLNVVFTNDTGINYTGATTTAVFRDPAAWYHVTVACDTTQATNTNRIRIYINGVIQTTVVFSTGYPSLNDTGLINLNRLTLIGQYASVQFFDGELAEVNFVDGYPTGVTSGTWAATNVATIFGAFSTYNQWLPKKYAGPYGTNGFYLPFTNTTGSSFSSYAGTFDGSTQSISVASNAAFQFTADFTLEGWIYLTAANLGKSFYATGSSGTTDIQCNVSSGGFAQFFSPGGGTSFGITGTTALAQNTWYHFAVTRSGSTVRLFVNGTQEASGTNSATMPSALSATFIGSYLSTTFPFTGRISNFRVVKGTAVYTNNFVVSTAPLTAISGTSLLTLQNATIIDNSTNAFAITNPGTVVTSTQTVTTVATQANLTADSSGNANNWTPNNISLTAGSTYDSLTDVPTLTSTTVANYAVLNPLKTTKAPTEGNLAIIGSSSLITDTTYGSIGVTGSGTYYFECIGPLAFGINTQDVNPVVDQATGRLVYNAAAGGIYSGSTALQTGLATAGATDVVGVALSLTGSVITFYKNGVQLGTPVSITPTNTFWPFLSSTNTNTSYANFGQRPWSYNPPSGFLPLNTFNIAAGTVTTSGTFTGNASTDGPMVYLNGTPTAMTINGNAVTFGTQADKLANGFKVRSSSASYNTAGSNTYVATTVGAVFKYEDAQSNP